jgi:hypothetical protein
MPNQTAVPWIQAIGNRIAPAIKKPQDAVLRHTMMCVIQDAITQPTKINGTKSSMMPPLWVNVGNDAVVSSHPQHFIDYGSASQN